jgi:hypothetical protein
VRASRLPDFRLAFLIGAPIGTFLLIVGLLVACLAGAFSVKYIGHFRRLDHAEFAGVASLREVQVGTPEGELTVWSYQSSPLIRAAPAQQGEINRYAPVFAEEFGIYPVSLVRQARLGRIVLCTQLKVDSQPAGGVFEHQQATIFLDVNYLSDDRSHARKAIHHEFFHLLDYRDDGTADMDFKWVALNAPGCRYGTGGSAARVAGSDANSERHPGFFNLYSTSAVEEDKAEVFANMIVEPNYVKARAAADPVIKAKVARMKELLADF